MSGLRKWAWRVGGPAVLAPHGVCCVASKPSRGLETTLTVLEGLGLDTGLDARSVLTAALGDSGHCVCRRARPCCHVSGHTLKVTSRLPILSQVKVIRAHRRSSSSTFTELPSPWWLGRPRKMLEEHRRLQQGWLGGGGGVRGEGEYGAGTSRLGVSAGHALTIGARPTPTAGSGLGSLPRSREPPQM